jgi:isochorismate hydrolase
MKVYFHNTTYSQDLKFFKMNGLLIGGVTASLGVTVAQFAHWAPGALLGALGLGIYFGK